MRRIRAFPSPDSFRANAASCERVASAGLGTYDLPQQCCAVFDSEPPGRAAWESVPDASADDRFLRTSRGWRGGCPRARGPTRLPLARRQVDVASGGLAPDA